MNPTRYTKLHHRSVYPSIRLDFPGLICFTETATFSSSGLIFLVWQNEELHMENTFRGRGEAYRGCFSSEKNGDRRTAAEP
ncbi:hypothetical protein L2E82_14912 [Cichorium intybus]|uniref:Uncharacterized protein n=1 Tax=Cichorium intybus TaxID=13427 RepID=A0ACB9F1D5_CICIN|nr:hypothetical protein L2E82_14912 [Cichorium intybus]